MAFIGMNVEEVRTLAASFTRVSDTITTATRQLDSGLANSRWVGVDAQRFRAEWSGQHRSSLDRISTLLTDISTELERQALEQQRASAADGGAKVSALPGHGHVKAPAGKQAAPDPMQWLSDLTDWWMSGPETSWATGKVFGFEYNEDDDFYYTNQQSMQSHFGFADWMDDAGPALGMDLATQIIEFEHDGQEYRVQLWKGSYGWESSFGGEIGLYVGDEAGGWYPVAPEDQRIQMIQTIYNSDDPSEQYFTSDTDVNLDGEPAYWNLAIRSDPGLGPEDLGQQGTLVVDDPGLQAAMAAAMADQSDGVEVWTDDSGIHYDWPGNTSHH